MSANSTLSSRLKQWGCRLGWHHWAIETRGIQVKGTIYPVRFRTCSRCGLMQREVFNEDDQSATWIEEQP
ncbi:MAG: hypothetical protein WC696_05550 [Candidatus Methylopumilus sp.]